MQLGTKRNYKEVEEKLLGFVLVCTYKLVPSCTEATVLLNVYPVFVSKLIVNLTFDNIPLMIEERITTLSKKF